MKNIKELIHYTEGFYVDCLGQRAVIEDALRVSKEDQTWALDGCYEALICDIIIAGLEEEKVRVWNRDPVNPEYIDVTIEEALQPSYEELRARCTKKVNVNNAIAKVSDLVYCCEALVNQLEIVEEVK